MIRVPREDRRRAVDLLQQHDAHELVRPVRRAEGRDAAWPFRRATAKARPGRRSRTPRRARGRSSGAICSASFGRSIASPRGSSSTVAASAGMRFASAIDSSSMRRGASRAALRDLHHFDRADAEPAADFAARCGIAPPDRAPARAWLPTAATMTRIGAGLNRLSSARALLREPCGSHIFSML